LAEAKENMRTADSSVAVYEREHGVLLTADESTARGLSDVVARRLALQVRRGYVSSFSSPESPEVREIDAELQAFDRQLDRFPQIKNVGQRLALDATIQRKVFSLLSAQYEEARLE